MVGPWPLLSELHHDAAWTYVLLRRCGLSARDALEAAHSATPIEGLPEGDRWISSDPS